MCARPQLNKRPPQGAAALTQTCGDPLGDRVACGDPDHLPRTVIRAHATRMRRCGRRRHTAAVASASGTRRSQPSLGCTRWVCIACTMGLPCVRPCAYLRVLCCHAHVIAVPCIRRHEIPPPLPLLSGPAQGRRQLGSPPWVVAETEALARAAPSPCFVRSTSSPRWPRRRCCWRCAVLEAGPLQLSGRTWPHWPGHMARCCCPVISL